MMQSSILEFINHFLIGINIECQGQSFVCDLQCQSFVCDLQGHTFVCDLQGQSFVCDLQGQTFVCDLPIGFPGNIIWNGNEILGVSVAEWLELLT